jgi:uncharacterized protein YjlB
MTMDTSIELVPLLARQPFPNNPRLPVIVYRAAVKLPMHGDAAKPIEQTFSRHGWSGGWRNGVFNYHHYHSTAHEVLGCYSGHAALMLGGPDGVRVELARGDVIVLPAGVAHKSIETSDDFKVVGAYAEGREYDMLRGKSDEPQPSEQEIARVPVPSADPVFGGVGPLLEHWQSSSR